MRHTVDTKAPAIEVMWFAYAASNYAPESIMNENSWSRQAAELSMPRHHDCPVYLVRETFAGNVMVERELVETLPANPDLCRGCPDHVLVGPDSCGDYYHAGAESGACEHCPGTWEARRVHPDWQPAPAPAAVAADPDDLPW